MALSLAAPAQAQLSPPAASSSTGAIDQAQSRVDLANTAAEIARLSATGNHARALTLAEALERRLETNLGREHTLLATVLASLASAYGLAGRVQDAAAALRRVLMIESARGAAAGGLYRKALYDLARLEEERGDAARAIELYEAALNALGAPASPQAVSAAGEYGEHLGELLARQGRHEEAENQLRAALVARQKSLKANDAVLASTFDLVAGVARARGKLAEAEAALKRAIEISTEARGGLDVTTAALLDKLAGVYGETGRLAEAETLQRRSLGIYEQTLGTDHLTSAEAAARLAGTLGLQKRFADALPHFARALDALMTKLSDTDPRLGLAHSDLAGALLQLGRLDGALEHYERGLAIRQKSYPPGDPEIGDALHDLAMVHLRLRRFADAEQMAMRAITIAEGLHGEGHPRTAMMLASLATALEGQGKQEAARAAAERAVGMSKATLGGEHPLVAGLLLQYGEMLASRGSLSEAAALLRRALDIADKAQEREQPGHGDLVERSRASGLMLDVLWRLALSDAGRPQDFAREAFEIAQRTAPRNAATMARLREHLAATNPAFAHLESERQKLARNWSETSRRLEKSAAGLAVARELTDGLRRRLADIGGRIDAFDARAATELSGARALARPRTLSVAEAETMLAGDAVLLSYHADPLHAYVWTVGRGHVGWQRLAASTSVLTEKIALLRCGLDEREWTDEKRAAACVRLLGRKPAAGAMLPFDLGTASELHDILIRPVEAAIAGKQLFIAASDPFASLPFGVLVPDRRADGGLQAARWLGTTHAIITLPEIADLRNPRPQAKAGNTQRPYFGVGNPVLLGADGDLTLAFAAQTCFAARPRRQVREVALTVVPAAYLRSGIADPAELRRMNPLPDTRDEICTLAQRLGARDSDLALGSRASEALIRDMARDGRLATYRVLHFATHGLIGGEFGSRAEPGLVLTPPDPSVPHNDGLLTASEVAGLNLDADWVILSASSTAGGEKPGAQGLAVLARSFIHAGAKALLVSHWTAQPAATVKVVTRLLSELHNGAIGPAEAMRRALAAHVADDTDANSSHPQMWAAFMLIANGNVRPTANLPAASPSGAPAPLGELATKQPPPAAQEAPTAAPAAKAPAVNSTAARAPATKRPPAPRSARSKSGDDPTSVFNKH